MKSARPVASAATARRATHDAIEHKAAFDGYMRSGESAGLRALEVKAMSVGSNPDGGYVCRSRSSSAIGARLTAISPIRSIAGQRTISGNVYKKPFMTAGPAVGWVGETDARTQTTSPVLDSLSFPAMELYAMPAATSTLARRRRRQHRRVARRRGRAGLRRAGGHGLRHRRRLQQAEGLPQLHHGRQRLVGLGQASATSPPAPPAPSPATDPSDVLVDLIYAVKAGYRQNGSFVMNRKTQAAVRKFKDAGGNYLWQPPAQAGGRASLMTFPVVEAEDMPDVAANSLSVAFGDFGRGYLVVDRAGVRVLRDPFTAKPYVLFYTTKRVGGGVQDFDAIKVLKFAAA